MPELAKNYLDMLLTERSWSWTVIGIVYLLLAMIIRSWFLAPIAIHVKTLKGAISRELKGHYMKRAFWGWIFFIFSFLIVIGLWSSGSVWPFTPKELLAAAAGIVSFVFFIIFHVEAIGIGAVKTLKRVTDKEEA